MMARGASTCKANDEFAGHDRPARRSIEVTETSGFMTQQTFHTSPVSRLAGRRLNYRGLGFKEIRADFQNQFKARPRRPTFLFPMTFFVFGTHEERKTKIQKLFLGDDEMVNSIRFVMSMAHVKLLLLGSKIYSRMARASKY